jgi:NADH dehydrogenase [ubiquinone] 1 alpha subcomplex assembly factor 7
MKQRIVDRIVAGGPMFFDTFMDMCLYDPDDGFFSSGRVRAGTEADFVTSPEVSPLFGGLVGVWASNARAARSPILVEIGAGSGSLMEELAPYWFDVDLVVYAVEVSADARDAITRLLPNVTVVASFEDLPQGGEAVVVANEVLDNLPAALARRTDQGWVEIAVDACDGDLALTDVPARAEVIGWCDEVFDDVPDGAVVSGQLAAQFFIEGVLKRFKRVSMCIIDYGAPATDLARKDASSVVRTYKSHRSGHDWLEHPSETDITVDVNTTAITRTAQSLGARVSTTTQRGFLLDHGIKDLIDDAVAMERHNASSGQVMEQMVSRSQRVNLEALLDPENLGAFQVVIVESGT